MSDTQLMKGILEGCVLGVIAKGETYGYEILAQLETAGFEELREGTLYPVLTRLDKKGYIHCRKAKSPLGPIRKYYTITLPGKQYLEDFKKNYRQVTDSAERILFGDDRAPERKGVRRA
ncbi:MAG: PadR family transcriptional regulator [Eubacteriales bacterium]|nr:PadR family transcriptional regulator [Eubacteriales bacterium]